MKVISFILCIFAFIIFVAASITEKYSSYTPIAIILIGCASLLNGLRFLKINELKNSGKFNIIIGIVMICLGGIVLAL
ncbi:hypothetical protein [Lysinibacillus endophyticus]|uniref:hypothetical protein n=1 Tax=Ureibacillus endophyticus TaxID=1978490 RepID=UPI0031355C23